MKLINESIKVMAIFNTDGVIQPVKFRLNEQVVYVEKVIRTYEEKFSDNNRIVFVCQHGGKDIYEIKYEVRTKKWYLYKK